MKPIIVVMGREAMGFAGAQPILRAVTVIPTRDDIVEAISGNIGRCTGYAQIVEAIALAAERMRGLNQPAAE